MNYIHLALFIGIAICLLIISFRSEVEEGFDDGSTLVFTTEQCPLLSSQLAGYKSALEAAQADNQFSTARSYNQLISAMEDKIKAAGCTGKEEAAKVPMALPSSMSSAEVEAAKEPVPVINLSQPSAVPIVATSSVNATKSGQ